ncbi:retrovirus-related pol polyprotein from transposon TNT 1-94 [Tanacetum coccineum]
MKVEESLNVTFDESPPLIKLSPLIDVIIGVSVKGASHPVFPPLTGYDRLVSESASPTPLLNSTPPIRHAEDSVDSDTSGARPTSLDFTTPLLLDHPLTHTTPTLVPFLCRTVCMDVRVPPEMSPSLFVSITEVVAMFDSAFHKRFRSYYKSSPSLSPPDLPLRKRYRGTSKLVEDDDKEEEEEDDEEGDDKEVDEEIEESLDSDSESKGVEDDEGPTAKDEDPTTGDEVLAAGDEGLGIRVESLGLGGDEAVPEGQQRATPVMETVVGEPLGLGYEALRCQEIALGEGRMPSVFKIDLEDDKVYIDVPAYPPPTPLVQTPPSPEWSSSSLPVSPTPSIIPSPISSPMIPLTIPSPVASPAMAEAEGLLTELGARVEMSGAVRDEIFSQRYRLRSLEPEQERVAVTFGAIWRLVLALESWADTAITKAGTKLLHRAYFLDHGIHGDLNTKKLSVAIHGVTIDDDVGEEEAIINNTKVVNNNNDEDESIEVDKGVNIKESKNHPLDQVIGNLNQRTLRSQAQNHSNFFCFISTIEPKNVNEALKDESWVVAMQEELNQFVANDVWDLVPLPMSQSVIGTKWVFRNKLDENGIVSRNKARLVAQGYNQQEGIDYDETYAPVARLESIRILLAIACANDFKLYQMDVKSAFLNGFINEEVYVAQPLGFIDFQKPNYVYKLKKALYGLKQAPKAWYDRLKAFLIKHEYSIGMVDNTLFTKKSKSHLIIVQIYVDDIIFGSTSQNLCDDFAKIMHDEFEMSMTGELNFFLGLQIKQMEDGILFNQSKYIKEMLKDFGLENSKPTKTPMSTEIKLTKDDEADSVDSSKYRGMIGTLLYLTASRPDIMFSVCLCARFQENPNTTHLEAIKRIFRYIRGTTHLGLWYSKGTEIETIVYADSDHAGDYVDCKSTSGVCTFMGCCLTSLFAKKQMALAISTAEAKYVFAGNACQRALWMKQALIDYDVCLNDVLIMCDNKGAIDLSKNPVQHSRTKHIEIRHHFLRDNIQKDNISIEKVASEDNIADIFTKPLKREVFNYLRLGLGMI